VVLKSTHDRSYIPRLRKQAEKQNEASQISYQHIRIPRIYDVKETDDSLTIKMEYVYSQNFIDYFEDAGFDRIEYFIKALKIFIDAEIDGSEIKNVSKRVITDKYDDVKNKIMYNEQVRQHLPNIEQSMNKISGMFSSLPENISIPVGKCHGDLTYSNILFNGNNYYLIDFLDSFIESPLMDIVKIRQDSCHGWSQLMYNKHFDRIRLMLINKKIDFEINDYYGQYEWYQRYYNVMQLMNLLRIMQYAKEKRVIDYLDKEIRRVLCD